MDANSPHNGKAKKKRAIWLWVAIVALIIIGAVIAYFVNKNTSASSRSSSKKPFAAVVNSTVPMVITINTRAQGDKTGSIAVEQSDGKGNYKYMLMSNGEPFNTTVYTPDAFYTCNIPSSPCLKYPRASPNSQTFDPSGLLYTSSLINKIKAIATYHGQQNCPVGTGTCDVWSTIVNADKRMDYVNTANKNIVLVIDAGHFGTTAVTTDIVYEYKDVHIAVPTNYTNGPAQSQ